MYMGFRCVHRSECVYKSGVHTWASGLCTGLNVFTGLEYVHRSGVYVCTGVECVHRPMSGYESVCAQVGVGTSVDVCVL